jgi:diketogulonate reductase-like aldo/keto reductase
MPMLGLGVWQVPRGRETEQAVGWALEAGYRHIDTARAYDNEDSVGVAIRASGLPREQIFVTTKLLPSARDAEQELRASLQRLGLDYVDLYLIHAPPRDPTWFWSDLERLHRQGLARAIGVSNYGVRELGAVLGRAQIRPMVNQVQFSPFQYRRRLLEFCHSQGILFEGFSPLNRGRGLGQPPIPGIAQRLGRTPAQVMLRWSLQHAAVTIPKSTHRERILENARVFDFALTPEDMAALDRLDQTGQSDQA